VKSQGAKLWDFWYPLAGQEAVASTGIASPFAAQLGALFEEPRLHQAVAQLSGLVKRLQDGPHPG
jgi:hypothetical protein